MGEEGGESIFVGEWKEERAKMLFSATDQNLLGHAVSFNLSAIDSEIQFPEQEHKATVVLSKHKMMTFEAESSMKSWESDSSDTSRVARACLKTWRVIGVRQHSATFRSKGVIELEHASAIAT